MAQLGQIVAWKVPQTVTLTKLREGLARAGLGQELAGDMAPRNALRRALRDMKEGRVIRELRREGDLLYFQITAEHLTDMEVTYDKEAELWLNVLTGDVYSTVQPLADQARDLLRDHMQKRLTGDLTRLVQRVFDSKRGNLIPIREQGGCYFVPDNHKAMVDQCRVLLKEIGGNLRSFAIELGGGDEHTQASVADSMFEYVRSLIREYRESLEEITKGTRSDVVERKHGTSAEIRQKMNAYRTIMGSGVDVLDNELTAGDKYLAEAMLREAPVKEPERVQQKFAEDGSDLTGVIPMNAPLQGVGV